MIDLQAMQHGSVIQTSRKEGPNVWQFRWSEKDLNGKRVYRKPVIGTVEQYADPAAVRHAASGLISEANLRSRKNRIGAITIDQLCEHFEQSEIRQQFVERRNTEDLPWLHSAVGQATLGLTHSGGGEGCGSGSMVARA